MDAEKTERLRRLQMEDLGTARREYISTVDDRRVKKARLEDIEATRLSNQPGTQAQRLAQQNQQQLSEWKNVFKKIGDTNDLENLDDLLNGQSHRLQLSAALRGAGVYEKNVSSRTTDNYPKVSETLLAAPTRGSKSQGRGGSIIGTRTHSNTNDKPASLSGTSNNAASSKPGRHIPQASGTRKASLDPALDINRNDLYPKAREKQAQNKPQHQFRKNKGNGTKSLTPAIVKTRRPIDTSKLPPHKICATPEKDADRSTQSLAEPSAPLQSPEKPATIPIPTKAPNEDRMTYPRTAQVIHSHKLENTDTVVDQPEMSTPLSFKTANKDQPASESGGEQLQTRQNLQIELSATKPPQLSTPSKIRALTKPFDGPEDLLLDLSSTPPTKDSLANDDSLIMTPSLQDLEGLEFRQSSTDTPESPLSYIPQRRIKSEDLSKNTSSNEKYLASAHANKEGNCNKYQCDIEMLCKLMASASLSGKHRESLVECKAELEAKLKRVQQTSTLTPATPEPSVESISKGNRGPSDPQIQSSPSPLSRLNVTAAPFIPTISNVPPTPAEARPRSVSFAVHPGHIFGDHLLPGQREQHALLEPMGIHIFGDHLLPGRRLVSESGSIQVKFNIPSRTPVLLKASILGFEGSEDSTPTPQLLSDNTHTAIRMAPVSKPVGRSDAPGSQLQESMHAPNENKFPVAKSSGQALRGLQSSMHAVYEKSKPIR
ncbi:hypothetical protein BDV28DRAFT_132223 [Aspergillus coremiiformis]|uniref:Uncharacterized protein n=1 Tax=Aspergillus coremiiformis TaxID=138285 RepID=A0A5N6Z8E1_9EURO|nr:hypothetical protein BDV28DRAFT_132223 [Aspergillus coremiiformis]